MPLERPQMAMIADAVQTKYDGPVNAEPGKGALAGLVMRLMHAIAMDAFEAAGEVVSDDVTFEIVATPIRFPVHRAEGREAVLAALRANFPMVTDQRLELLAFVEDAGQCVMVAHEVCRLVASGATYEGYTTSVFTFADGRVARIVNIAAPRVTAS